MPVNSLLQIYFPENPIKINNKGGYGFYALLPLFYSFSVFGYMHEIGSRYVPL